MIAAGASPRVVIVHGSALVRGALSDLLGAGGVAVLAASKTLADVASTDLASADVLLLDQAAAVRGDRAAIDGVTTLVFDVEDDDGAIVDCVRSGAATCLLEDASLEDVVAAVRSAAAGRPLVHPRVSTTLFRYVAARGADDPVTAPRHLTEREEQILALVSEGLSNKEIAARLSLQPQSVKNYVHLVLQKLGAHDRYELIRTARSAKAAPSLAAYA